MTKLDALVRFIKDFFRARTEEEILRTDLHEALLARNSAEGAVEYATSMVEYNEKRIARLNQRLNEISKAI